MDSFLPFDYILINTWSVYPHLEEPQEVHIRHPSW